ncbi:MAG: hypothetical protein KAJ14_03870, partial [Candidatus Omnitrophica bacterium]|nr:hypothetical protein [Candidatus Omnitrophota bacterium]
KLSDYFGTVEKLKYYIQRTAPPGFWKLIIKESNVLSFGYRNKKYVALLTFLSHLLELNYSNKKICCDLLIQNGVDKVMSFGSAIETYNTDGSIREDIEINSISFICSAAIQYLLSLDVWDQMSHILGFLHKNGLRHGFMSCAKNIFIGNKYGKQWVYILDFEPANLLGEPLVEDNILELKIIDTAISDGGTRIKTIIKNEKIGMIIVIHPETIYSLSDKDQRIVLKEWKNIKEIADKLNICFEAGMWNVLDCYSRKTINSLALNKNETLDAQDLFLYVNKKISSGGLLGIGSILLLGGEKDICVKEAAKEFNKAGHDVYAVFIIDSNNSFSNNLFKFKDDKWEMIVEDVVSSQKILFQVCFDGGSIDDKKLSEKDFKISSKQWDVGKIINNFKDKDEDGFSVEDKVQFTQRQLMIALGVEKIKKSEKPRAALKSMIALGLVEIAIIKRGQPMRIELTEKGEEVFSLFIKNELTTEQLWKYDFSRWVYLENLGINLSRETPFKTTSEFYDAYKLFRRRYSEMEKFLNKGRFSEKRYFIWGMRCFGMSRNDIISLSEIIKIKDIKKDAIIENIRELGVIGLLEMSSERGKGYFVNDAGNNFFRYILSGEEITPKNLESFGVPLAQIISVNSKDKVNKRKTEQNKRSVTGKMLAKPENAIIAEREDFSLSKEEVGLLQNILNKPVGSESSQLLKRFKYIKNINIVLQLKKKEFIENKGNSLFVTDKGVEALKKTFDGGKEENSSKLSSLLPEILSQKLLELQNSRIEKLIKQRKYFVKRKNVKKVVTFSDNHGEFDDVLRVLIKKGVLAKHEGNEKDLFLKEECFFYKGKYYYYVDDEIVVVCVGDFIGLSPDALITVKFLMWLEEYHFAVILEGNHEHRVEHTHRWGKDEYVSSNMLFSYKEFFMRFGFFLTEVSQLAYALENNKGVEVYRAYLEQGKMVEEMLWIMTRPTVAKVCMVD